jgi:hypothetical protein
VDYRVRVGFGRVLVMDKRRVSVGVIGGLLGGDISRQHVFGSVR